MVALMILASTLVCAVSATHNSRNGRGCGARASQGQRTGQRLLEVSPTTPGETAGEANGFT
ncbi:hypothetical protein ACRAWD_10820 [Caulobacter segnis]